MLFQLLKEINGDLIVTKQKCENSLMGIRLQSEKLLSLIFSWNVIEGRKKIKRSKIFTIFVM